MPFTLNNNLLKTFCLLLCLIPGVHTTIAQTCNTSTFYMHLAGLPGEKISLSEAQTLSDGRFAISGNTQTAGGGREGMLMIMTNDGSLVSQKKIKVNNIPVVIYGSKVTPAGNILVAGVLQYGTPTLYIAQLTSAFSINWQKTYTMPSNPEKVTIDIYDTMKVAVAAQMNTKVACITFNNDGTQLWSKNVTFNNLTSINGFSTLGFDSLAVVANSSDNGLKTTTLIPFAKANGNYRTSYTLAPGSNETRALHTMGINGRLYVIDVEKSATGNVSIRKSDFYSAMVFGENYTYQLSQVSSDNITAAVTRNATVMGICVPESGKLLFIKHYLDSYTSVQQSRQYNVPTGASIASVNQSYDGGYLFGINSADSSEVIFIKTDSIGTLSDCPYDIISPDMTQAYGQKNVVNAISAVSYSYGISPGATSFSSYTGNTTFNCRQNYCPVVPDADRCMSSYQKMFRTNTAWEIFNGYYLMRNNHQLAITTKSDNLQGGYSISYPYIRLLDEIGNQIQAKAILTDGIANTSFSSYKVSDSTIILVSNILKNGLTYISFTLVTDNLDVVWTKAINIQSSSNVYSDFTTILHQDENGNFYYIGGNSGFNNKANIVVYKMDANGNPLWTKSYDLGKNNVYISTAASTHSALLVITEGYDQTGSISIRLDKQTGTILNSYSYQSGYGNILYKRTMRFDNDHLFYAGSNYLNNNSDFTVGILDTTGKPLKFRMLPKTGIAKTSDLFNSKLYSTFNYTGTSGNMNVVLCIDSTLNFVFAKHYQQYAASAPVSLQVGNNGSVYIGSNYMNGISDAYPFITKYTSDGVLGSCVVAEDGLTFTDINLQPVAYNSLQALTVTTTNSNNITVTLQASTSALHTAAMLCSSYIECNELKIKSPGPVCRLLTPYTYTVRKNTQCSIRPDWYFDTSFVSIQQTTDTSAILLFKKTGTTKIRAFLNNGCLSLADSIIINIQNSPAVFSLGNDTTVCASDSIMLNASNGFNSYLWQDSSTDSIITVKTGGQYYVQVSNSCGDVYSDTIHIQQAIIPVISLGKDTAVCLSDTIPLNASGNFASYQWTGDWNTNEQTQTILLPVTGSKQIIVTGNTTEHCHASDTIFISVIQPPNLYLGKDTTFCTGDSMKLSAPAAFVSYIWNTGEYTPSVQIKTAGTFWVTVTDNNGCRAKDTITTNTYAAPVIPFGNDHDICSGDTSYLDAGIHQKYLWQDGTTTRFYPASAIGSYHVTVMNADGCSLADTIQIISVHQLPSQFLQAIDSICQYDKLTLTPSQSFTGYRWSTGSTAPAITITQSGSYILNVTDFNGCKGSDTTIIIARNCMEGVYIPTAFSPNNDQRNDVFRARVYGPLVSFRLAVFNRWGEQVFTTTDPAAGWDGTYKGSLIGNNTYVWMCTYQLKDSPPVAEKGTVTIVK